MVLWFTTFLTYLIDEYLWELNYLSDFNVSFYEYEKLILASSW